MRKIAVPFLCLLAFAGCAGSGASTAKKKAEPRLTPVTEHQRVPVPDGWKEETDSDSVLLGAPCDLRLISPVPDVELCIKIAPAAADPFPEIPVEMVGAVKQKFESEGWSDVNVLYEPSRKLLGLAGTRTVSLPESAKPAPWRIRYVRADLANDPGQALLMFGVAPAKDAAAMEAAVDAVIASLPATAAAPAAP